MFFKLNMEEWEAEIQKAKELLDKYDTELEYMATHPVPLTRWEAFVDKVRIALHGFTYYLFKPIFFTLNWLWAGIQDAWEESKL